MSLLEHIIDRVRSGERVFENWSMLKNSYFRGDTGYQDMLDWASENGIVATPEDIKNQSFDHIEFETVEFHQNPHCLDYRPGHSLN